MKDLVPIIQTSSKQRFCLQCVVKFFLHVTEHFFREIVSEETKEEALREFGRYNFIGVQPCCYSDRKLFTGLIIAALID